MPQSIAEQGWHLVMIFGADFSARFGSSELSDALSSDPVVDSGSSKWSDCYALHRDVLTKAFEFKDAYDAMVSLWEPSAGEIATWKALAGCLPLYDGWGQYIEALTAAYTDATGENGIPHLLAISGDARNAGITLLEKALQLAGTPGSFLSGFYSP